MLKDKLILRTDTPNPNNQSHYYYWDYEGRQWSVVNFGRFMKNFPFPVFKGWEGMYKDEILRGKTFRELKLKILYDYN